MSICYPKRFIAATKEYNTIEKHVPAPYLRKSFTLEKIENSQIILCGLGFYELYINGVNITKGLLAPYISNPDQFLPYDVYDVTKYLVAGENVIGVILGNGILNAPGGEEWHFDRAEFRSAPKLALAFYAGDKLLFESDESFLTKPSPITFDDFRCGEHYDARLEMPDWNLPSCDTSDWKPAIPAKTPKGECRIINAEPIKKRGEIAPISVTKAPSGAYIYDFGIEFTGVCRLKIKGARGQEIKMTHADVVLDGELNLANIICGEVSKHPGYVQCDRYILKGEGEERYTPRFVYHGFQYVSVEGLTEEQATLDLLTYETFHSDLTSRGSFVCSDEVLNKLQKNTRRSDLSNTVYFPTDCPHREKNGWTGDAVLSADQMLLNFDYTKTFRDWLAQIRLVQKEDGSLPGIVPTGGWGFAWGSGPNWDAILIELTHELYRYTGNQEIISENIESINKYVNYLVSRKKEDGLVEFGLGDWCAPPIEREKPVTEPISTDCPVNVPVEITDTLKAIDMCRKAATVAKAIGDEEKWAYFERERQAFRAAFRAKFVQGGKLINDEQTVCAWALYEGVVCEEKEAVQAQLLERIRQDGRFTTGVLGARVLFRVLTEMGEGELAYRLITDPTVPSYGYHIARGATTLYESFRWLKDGEWRRIDGRYIDSRNHHFFGDVSAWMISYVAGIRINPDCTDKNHIVVAPAFLSPLTFAESSFDHDYGEIRSRWERTEKGVEVKITIPVGVTADVKLPDGTRQRLEKAGEYRFSVNA